MGAGLPCVDGSTMPPDDAPEQLTPFDWLGACLAGLPAFALLAFPVQGRRFAAMFADFGAQKDLPVLTRLAVSVSFPVALGLLVVVLIGAGVTLRAPLAARRACIIAGFVLGVGAFALCLVGLYLPIFSLAGNIKAE